VRFARLLLSPRSTEQSSPVALSLSRSVFRWAESAVVGAWEPMRLPRPSLIFGGTVHPPHASQRVLPHLPSGDTRPVKGLTEANPRTRLSPPTSSPEKKLPSRLPCSIRGEEASPRVNSTLNSIGVVCFVLGHSVLCLLRFVRPFAPLRVRSEASEGSTNVQKGRWRCVEGRTGRIEGRTWTWSKKRRGEGRLELTRARRNERETKTLAFSRDRRVERNAVERRPSMASFGLGRLFGRSGGTVQPQKGSTESTMNTLEKLQEVSCRKNRRGKTILRSKRNRSWPFSAPKRAKETRDD